MKALVLLYEFFSVNPFWLPQRAIIHALAYYLRLPGHRRLCRPYEGVPWFITSTGRGNIKSLLAYASGKSGGHIHLQSSESPHAPFGLIPRRRGTSQIVTNMIKDSRLLTQMGQEIHGIHRLPVYGVYTCTSLNITRYVELCPATT